MPPVDQNHIRRRGVGTQAYDEAQAFDGYTLIAPLTGKAVHLVDNHGRQVHSWELPYRIGRHARLLPNGNLAVNCKDPDAPAPFPFFNKYGGGIYLEVTPSGEIVRDFRDPLGHHDCYQFGDGHYLYTALQPLTTEQANALPGGVPGTEAPDGKVYSDTIVEVVNGQKVWEWKVAEKLDPNVFPLQAHYVRSLCYFASQLDEAAIIPQPREHWPLINAV